MATKTEQHIHKFKRIVYKSGNAVFFCATSDCNKRLNISLALGKRSLCWRCGESFIMTEYSLRLAKPHCEKCHKSKNDNIKDVKTDIIKITSSTELTLAERLQQELNKALESGEDEI